MPLIFARSLQAAVKINVFVNLESSQSVKKWNNIFELKEDESFVRSMKRLFKNSKNFFSHQKVFSFLRCWLLCIFYLPCLLSCWRSWWEEKLKFHDVMKCMSMKSICILLNNFISITLSCWNIDGTILKQLSAIWPSLLISSMYCFKYFLKYI